MTEQLYKFEPSKWETESDKKKGKKKEKPLSDFEGYIMLKPPTFDECMEYMEDLGVDLVAEDEDGKKEKGLSKEEKQKNAAKAARQMRNMVKLSEKHYEKVSLSNKKTTSRFNSFQDLSIHPECRELLGVVGGLVIRGFGPSKHP